MSQTNPSTDWPLRINALTGDELFLKQNGIDDPTPAPKEEMVKSQLISDFALSKLNSFTFSGDTLTLNIEDGTDLSTVLTSENGIFSVEILNKGFKITLNNSDEYIINLENTPMLSRIDNFLVSAEAYPDGNILLNEDDGNYILTTTGVLINAQPTFGQMNTSSVFRIDMRNGQTFSISLDSFAQNGKLSSVELDETTYDLSFEYPDTTSVSINISDFAEKLITQRIYKNQDAVDPADVNNILYHYRHLRGYNNYKIKNIHFYVGTAGVNSGSLTLRCETPSTSFFLPTLTVGETEKSLDVDLSLDENFFLNIYLDSNSFNVSDAPKGLYLNITMI